MLLFNQLSLVFYSNCTVPEKTAQEKLNKMLKNKWYFKRGSALIVFTGLE